MVQTPLRIVQISDLHLTTDDPASLRQFDAVVKKATELAPRRIVLTGDLTNNGCTDPQALAWGKKMLAKLPAPVSIFPGNHDVGDKRGGGEIQVTTQRVAAWRNCFGEDHFVIEHDGWRLVGFDSLIAGSGLPEDAAQLTWLDAQLSEAETKKQRLAMFMHEPPFLLEPGRVFGDKSDYWPMHQDAQPAYLDRLTRPAVRLVASGHVHWGRSFEFRGARHVWCPSPAFIVDDAKFPRGGGVQGVTLYEFGPGEPKVEFVHVDGPERWVYFNQPRVEIPGREPIVLAELALDFTGALAKDGRLIPGVTGRLRAIAASTRVSVLSADTSGAAQRDLAGLPVEVMVAKTGQDKADRIKALGAEKTVYIGNGKNDVEACEAAAISIAVVGVENASDVLRHANVVAADISDALDLVVNPLRLKASLRN